jgi:predicted lipid-binding transport protein (Tim44 family)
MYDTAVMPRPHPSSRPPAFAPAPAQAGVPRRSDVQLAQAAREAAERAYLAVPANDVGDAVDRLADQIVEAFFAELKRRARAVP